jgi:hypothetical protein
LPRSILRTSLLLAALLCAVAPAWAGVLVAPTRLIFEGSERNGEFVLLNKGTTTERYRVSVVNLRMNDEGRIVEAPEALEGDRFADLMVRFSPRTVVLPPDDPQTIRILVRRPDDLPAGEYRTHLMLQQVPEAPPAAPDRDPEAAAARGISIQIRPMYGVTVPIIIRHGRLAAEGALSDLALVPGEEPRHHVQIQREGDRSLYGDLEVTHEAPGEPSRTVGLARGVALYTPNASRPFEVPLTFPGGGPPTTGQLRVEYRDAEPGASSLIAEAAVALTAD